MRSVRSAARCRPTSAWLRCVTTDGPKKPSPKTTSNGLVNNVDTEFDGRLDVMFTHDAPAQVKGLKSGMSGIPFDVLREAEHGRRLLAEAVDRTQPTYVLHGHWHQANTERISDRTEVIGLAEDGRQNHTALLSTQPTLVAAYI